jgi:pyruvate ferredoxin oxidoreductase alpha subunit
VETLQAFGKHFGRTYKPVETYRAEDAEVLLVTMGSIGETAMSVVDARRKKGHKVGLLRIRLWRPFPFEDLYRAVGAVQVLGVIDRALSFGGPLGPVASEIKGAFYRKPQQPRVVEFIAGLGGRDVSIPLLERMFDTLLNVRKTGQVPPPAMVGVRE